ARMTGPPIGADHYANSGRPVGVVVRHVKHAIIHDLCLPRDHYAKLYGWRTGLALWSGMTWQRSGPISRPGAVFISASYLALIDCRPGTPKMDCIAARAHTHND